MGKKKWLLFALLGISLCGVSTTAFAKENDMIESGVYADTVSLAGLTGVEADAAIRSYVNSYGTVPITLHAVDGNDVTVTAADLGLFWANPEIADEAVSLGKGGNIVQRYKALKDLTYSNKVYEVEFAFDRDAIEAVIEEQATLYDQPAIDAYLTRTDGEFQITDGQIGYAVDVEASTDEVYAYLTENWNGAACDMDLVIEVEEPQGKTEDLELVQDVLGTFTTSYSTSGSDRSANVVNGCRLINGTTVYPGEEFSALELITPFTTENGYYMAASYINGEVVDSLGGGICQVSTTLYNAVLLAELEVTSRSNHSMVVTYVQPSMDATVAESSGIDFKFVNTTDYPIYIEGYTTTDKHITFTIYGVETRPSTRKVSFESVVLEETPPTDIIYTDATKPAGYCSVSAGHTGYKAELWKIVTENGVQVSREQVNSSKYNMSARTATVGVATDDTEVYNLLMSTIAGGSIDQVQAVASTYAATGDTAAAGEAGAAVAAQLAAAAEAAEESEAAESTE